MHRVCVVFAHDGSDVELLTQFFCVFTCRDAKIITEVIKVARLPENPSVGPEQGRRGRHSLQLLLREVKASPHILVPVSLLIYCHDVNVRTESLKLM